MSGPSSFLFSLLSFLSSSRVNNDSCGVHSRPIRLHFKEKLENMEILTSILGEREGPLQCDIPSDVCHTVALIKKFPPRLSTTLDVRLK